MEAQVNENFLTDDQYKFFNKHSTKTDYGVIRLGKFFFDLFRPNGFCLLYS